MEVHSRRWCHGKESTGNARDTCFIPGGEDPLKKEMATQSSILAWEIPRREACSPPSSSLHGILQARILEQVATPTSRGSSPPRDQSQVSHIAGGFFTIWATREAYFSVLFTNLLYTDMYYDIISKIKHKFVLRHSDSYPYQKFYWQNHFNNMFNICFTVHS